MTTWDAYPYPPSQEDKKFWLWLLLFGVALVFMLACACAVFLGPGFMKGFRQGYQQALATATARAVQDVDIDRGRSISESDARPGVGVDMDRIALRVRINTLDTPRVNEDVRVAVVVANAGMDMVTLYWVAFRGSIAEVIQSADVLDLGGQFTKPSLPDGGVVVGVFFPQGLTLVPGERTEVVFHVYALQPGYFAGDSVLCISPDISPDTCRAIPVSLTVGE